MELLIFVVPAVLMIVAKLFGVISLSWWLVLLPVLLPLSGLLLLILIVGAAYVLPDLIPFRIRRR